MRWGACLRDPWEALLNAYHCALAMVLSLRLAQVLWVS